jgi:hypothetical protein
MGREALNAYRRNKMMDGSGWSPAKEKTFENLGSATGAPVPIVHMIAQSAAWMEMSRSFWRMFPLVAPFVPKEPS